MERFLLPARESNTTLSCLWRMRKEDELCDVNIQAGNTDTRRLPAHRCVMAACSPYFRAMFTSDLAESWQRDVRIAGVDFDIMKVIVSFAYSVEASVCYDKVLDLLMAADLFQMDSLLQLCCNYLQEKVTPQNVLSTRAYASLHRCWKLYKFCNDYILMNFQHIAKKDEFLQIPLEDLQDIVVNDCLRVTCEEQVYNAVKRWVYHDIDSRKYVFPSLICHVRLPFVSQHFLNMEVQNEELMADCQKYFSEAICYKNFPERRSELKDSIRIRPRKLFGLNEVMMMIGGMTKSGPIASIDQYDSRTDLWSTMTSSPVPCYGTAACLHNGFVYVTGGSNETERFINRMDIYNVVERRWSKGANLLTAKRYHAIVALFGLPTIIGGQTSDGVTTSVESYDSSSNKWSAGPSLHTPRMYHAAVGLDNGSAYAIGGHSGISRLASVECYRFGQWNYVASLPEPRSVLGAAVFMGGIYVAGGYNGKEHISTVNYYDPDSDTWITCPSMTTGRSAFGLVAYDGCLYACGGFTGSLTQTVECFIPGDSEWQLRVVTMPNDRIHFSILTT